MRGRLCTCEMSYLDYCEGQRRRTVHSDVLSPPGGTLGSAAPPCPAGPALSAARPPSIGPAFSAARSKPGGTSEGLHNRGRTVAIQRRTSVYIGLLERRTLGPCKLFGTLRVCSGCRCVTTTNRRICMCPCYQLDPSVAEESGYDGGQSQGVELRRRTVAGVRCPQVSTGAYSHWQCRRPAGSSGAALLARGWCFFAAIRVDARQSVPQHSTSCAQKLVRRGCKYNCQCCISLLDFHSGRIMALGKWQF
jgi:hypothetical protein